MAVTYKLEEIKRGDKGPSVFLVQQMLKARELKPGVPFYNGTLDKEFGPKTEQAVRARRKAAAMAGICFQ